MAKPTPAGLCNKQSCPHTRVRVMLQKNWQFQWNVMAMRPTTRPGRDDGHVHQVGIIRLPAAQTVCVAALWLLTCQLLKLEVGGYCSHRRMSPIASDQP